MEVAKNGNNAMVELLVKKGAIVTAQDDLGQTALMLAAFRNHGEVITSLVEVDKGANIDATDNNGWTALMYAAYENHEEVIMVFSW